MNDVSEATIGMLIQSNSEIKDVQLETNQTLNKLIEVSVRNEERQGQSADALKRLGDRVDILWDKVLKNSLIVNGALIVASLIIGSVATIFLGK